MEHLAQFKSHHEQWTPHESTVKHAALASLPIESQTYMKKQQARHAPFITRKTHERSCIHKITGAAHHIQVARRQNSATSQEQQQTEHLTMPFSLHSVHRRNPAPPPSVSRRGPAPPLPPRPRPPCVDAAPAGPCPSLAGPLLAGPTGRPPLAGAPAVSRPSPAGPAPPPPAPNQHRRPRPPTSSPELQYIAGATSGSVRSRSEILG